MKYLNVMALLGAFVFSTIGFGQDSLAVNSDEFVAQSANFKLERIWSDIVATQLSEADTLEYNADKLSELKLALLKLTPVNPFHRSYLRRTFEWNYDYMPEGRKKPIHPFGSTAQVVFEVTKQSVNSKGEAYTGLFEVGSIVQGLSRLSLAMPPSEDFKFTPGMGLKLLVDGHKSVDLVVMWSLDGQDSNNFFEHSFNQHLDTPSASNPLAISFERAIKKLKKDHHIKDGDEFFTKLHLPLFDMAAVKNNGEQILAQNIRAPQVIEFRPSDEAKNYQEGLASDQNLRALLAQSTRLKAGTKLYDVYVKETKNSEAQFIGTLSLASGFIASSVGDEKLMMVHSFRVILDND